ncbi:MAG: S49 family peptidase, partial [Vibrionaceae bacterium]
LVATERKLPLEEVEKIAQGRVWTGADALKHKLVDQIGDFDDAVIQAAKLAKLEKYTLNWLEEPVAPFELFISEFFGQALAKFGAKTQASLPAPVQKLIHSAQQELNVLQGLNDPQGHYVLCTDCQL